MKKIILIIFPIILYCQVGINTNSPHASSALDIDISNKGFLPPRVELKSTLDSTTIVKPATGLFIYNKSTAGKNENKVYPGFYYWNGERWALLETSLNTWNTKGNYNTDIQNNFIGTLDDTDLIFKRNNIQYGRLYKDNLALGNNVLEILNPTARYNIGIGSFSLQKNVNGISNIGIGAYTLAQNITSYNTAIGSQALSSVTSGDANTAIGNSSSQNNKSGRMNTSVGHNSLYQNYGSYNTGIGSYSLYSNMYGEYNTALGTNSLNKNSFGNYNVAVGTNSLSGLYSNLMNATDNNVAIGANSGKNLVSGNNNLMIGANTIAMSSNENNQLNIANSIFGINMGTSKPLVGIGVTAPSATLHVNGTTAFTVATSGINNTVILQDGGEFTPPNASQNNGVLYIVRNTSLNTMKINNIIDYNSTFETNIELSNAITIISNGLNWYRIQ